jgi:hypothetical protein
VVGVLLLLAAAAASQSIQLRPDQLLAFAESAQTRGDAATAEAAYKALSHDPHADIRNEARFRYSKMLAARGSTTDAAMLLRQILDEKPQAAPVRLELAGLLDRMGDKEGALRQIRAIQAGGLPPTVARLVDRYSEALRAQRPFGGSFEIALAPDSNINHATSLDKLGTVIGDFDIAKESQAKSGTGVSLRGQAYRRFSLGGEGRQLLVRLSGLGNLYKKSSFNDIILDLGAGPELQIGSSRVNLEAGVTQRWYGQKPYMRSARLGLALARPIGRRSQLRFTGNAALVDNRINDLEDGKDYSGELSFEHALSPTTGVSLSASALRESLNDPGYSATSWRLGLLGWRDVGRMTLTANVQYGRLQADERLSLFPDKRSDHYWRFSLGATVRRLSFQGFAPVARLVVERNKSTIAFYDYRRRRVEFGFERAF